VTAGPVSLRGAPPKDPWVGSRANPPKPAAVAVQYVPAPPAERAFSIILTLISVTIVCFLINLVLISPVQHYTSQKALFAELRLSLAEGATPVGPADADGKALAAGTPVAVMRAPAIGIQSEVIVEGTASGQTMQGIGHRRDTPLPCQVGTSVLMARSGSYGGVGMAWTGFRPGQQFTMQMGQGSCTYEIIGQRNVGDEAPPIPQGREGRITFITAAGAPYLPTEVRRIDAKLVSDGFDRGAISVPATALPDSEAAMGIDTSNLFGLVLLFELLVAAAFGAAWIWKRWGRWQTYVVAGPVLITIGLLVASNVNYLLPNLL
jgi:sortase A